MHQGGFGYFALGSLKEVFFSRTGGRHPAQWPGGRPASGTSSRIKKVFLFAKRSLEIFLSLPPPFQRAGGTYFSKFLQLAPLFRNFFNPLFTKKSGKQQHASSHNGLSILQVHANS
jgi:hypothetical protein